MTTGEEEREAEQSRRSRCSAPKMSRIGMDFFETASMMSFSAV